MAKKVHLEPAPLPENASARDRAKYVRDREKWLTDGGSPGVSQVPATVDPTDARLAQLKADHKNFMGMHSPMKMALWMALLRSGKDIIHADEMRRRYTEDQSAPGAGGAFNTPDKPAIVMVAEQLVAKALGGDVAAIDRISDRIEGKAGIRQGDTDAGEAAKAKQLAGVTEQLLRSLVEARLSKSGSATIIDVTPVDTKKDSE